MDRSTVIFDLDGTLLDTLDDLKNSVNHAMDRCGFPRRTRDEVRMFVGNGVRTLIHRAAPDAFGEHYRQHNRDNTAPYDGVTELLAALKNKGYKLAIVSNKLDFAVKALNDEFFGGIVDVAVGDSPDTRTKPEPDMVYKAIKMLGVGVDECVYIGDTNVDLATAKNAGMPCISVSWGFRDESELIGYGAEMIAHTPDDVMKFIES